MKLYLVRHGEPNEETIDLEKNLSERGRQDMEKVGVFLKNAAIFADDVFHSDKARAVQTAEILAKAVNLTGKAIQKEGLGPDDPIATLQAEIAGRDGDLMVVGHLPFLAKLASAMLTDSERNDLVQFGQGCVLCLERFGEKWQVKWMLTPELL